MKQEKKYILAKFKPFLWSYDLGQIDLEKDKKRIITNVLNLGTKEATDLLFKIYDKAEIKKQVEEPMPGEWSDKSLNYWSLFFDIQPQTAKHVLRHLG
ncbi:DUF6922 domain-containing protein [Desulfobacterium sp. N47]|uniref:DUF6922 domain-containing protein n=1 Tax=uncultured Desulfobacterium sp. TaxID=201089 RepID=E1YK97_9BACT|nr:unknown protein [uncultured Desulfobacterium sp.]